MEFQVCGAVWIASMDVNTAFGAAKPTVLAEVLRELGVLGCILSAIIWEVTDSGKRHASKLMFWRYSCTGNA